MARGRVSSEQADAVLYTENDWLRYGTVANPTTREKMILLAIEEIIELGPADFNTSRVCDRLDIKHPMVNHYFGNRDGLIAEAAWWSYQEWTDHVDQAFRQAPRDPKKRLIAFVRSEIEWGKKMGGMNLLINYPAASQGSQQIVNEQHGARMQELFQYHLALIATTVRDMRKGTVSDFDFTPSSVPKHEFVLSPGIIVTAGHISWMTHGLAMWSSGHHLGSSDIEQPGLIDLTVNYAIKQYIDLILRVAEKGI